MLNATLTSSLLNSHVQTTLSILLEKENYLKWRFDNTNKPHTFTKPTQILTLAWGRMALTLYAILLCRFGNLLPNVGRTIHQCANTLAKYAMDMRKVRNLSPNFRNRLSSIRNKSAWFNNLLPNHYNKSADFHNLL